MMPPLEWPGDLLDVEKVMANGFRPRPFREFVLKVHQRCNLACDYCYVYEMADQSWRERPPMMVPAIWQAAARRIRDHVRQHDLVEVRVILHGGEPLLAGRDVLRRLIEDIRATIGSTSRLRLSLQTNGLLLDEPMLDLLLAYGAEVGVSLDGAAEDNDRHRRHPDGRGSHLAVVRALTLLGTSRYRPIFSGILCTVDPRTDPVATYEALLSHRPPLIDFLLPHANWSRPPARPRGETPHGDWLVAVFDRWYDAPRKEAAIRLLEEIISLTLGGASRCEQVGLSPVAVAVVESDGAIEQVDSLKSAYPGACATGLNVVTDDFEVALRHPGVVARQLGVDALCGTCRACPIHLICGAGHYAHRYRAGSGFLNPSVYCGDMIRIIEHVRRRVAADLGGRLSTSLT
jgi:uncharacterized protein